MLEKNSFGKQQYMPMGCSNNLQPEERLMHKATYF
jgi:hypothetical protein